jgi:CubicO group peptidase (beta-lactamase class C family)
MWSCSLISLAFSALAATALGTRLRFADFERRPNRAFGQVKVGDSFQPKYQRLLDPQSPAGGFSSSANGLARWMALVLQNGKFEGRQVIPAYPPKVATIYGSRCLCDGFLLA